MFYPVSDLVVLELDTAPCKHDPDFHTRFRDVVLGCTEIFQSGLFAAGETAVDEGRQLQNSDFCPPFVRPGRRGEARARDRRVPADLSADLLATVPPTPRIVVMAAVMVVSPRKRVDHRQPHYHAAPTPSLPLACMEKVKVWFSYIASPQQGDLRLSGPPSGQDAGGKTVARDRRVPADLRVDSLAAVTPTPPYMVTSRLHFVESSSLDRWSVPLDKGYCWAGYEESEHAKTRAWIAFFPKSLSPLTHSRHGLSVSLASSATRKHACEVPAWHLHSLVFQTLFGHVMRREKLENLVTTGMLEGKRSRGKQREKLIEGLTDWRKAGKSLEAIEATKDRKKWRTMIANAVKQGT
ncbi:hypothetical protein PoB_005885400 [Plakobranchus ocellatus]|uniref:Uncharacterized protein n=1 Tax=Plakobranchus ocellatus TaxID=259542 RepID=A0AAV4CLZ0_9GAST|nr:hypothetical protein PoB_005885400 [Plakobranchus ocellatus]